MRATLLCSLMVFSACGGDWSNRDIEFATALPHRSDLKSKIPATASSTSPLTGISTRRDGLDVGDPSPAYAQALSASNSFNGILDFLLTVIDNVRQYPPTTRTADSRTWGPYPDNNNPGFEFKVTIAEVASADAGVDHFTWSLQAHPTNGDFFNVVVGEFDPTVSAKKGAGAMSVRVADFRDRLVVDDTFKQLDQINVLYDTASSPVSVNMAFAFKGGNDAGISSIGYAYRENSDLSGVIFYELTTSSPDTTVIDATAGWLSTGQGRAAEQVKVGKYAGFSVSECWDTAYKVTLYSESWDGGVTHGSPASCPTITGL